MAMVQRSQFQAQTGRIVLPLRTLEFCNQQITMPLGRTRLSPLFSPNFPCTPCGKPVLPYRSFSCLRNSELSGRRVSTLGKRPSEMLADISLFIRFCQEKSAPGENLPDSPSGSSHDRRLSAVLNCVLMPPSRASHLKNGTTCRPRGHPGHHHADSRHFRLCSRPKTGGSAAQFSLGQDC